MADSTITLRVVGDASAAPKAPDAAPATAPQAPGNAPAAAPQAPGGAPAAAATPGLGPAAPAASPAGGKSLAGPIAAFALGWGAQQLLGLGVNALASSPGRQRQANWLANVGGGALSGATAGAALGSAVPAIGTASGAAIGAAIGVGVGALNALADSAKGARDALEAIKAHGHDYALATGVRGARDKVERGLPRALRRRVPDGQRRAVGVDQRGLGEGRGGLDDEAVALPDEELPARGRERAVRGKAQEEGRAGVGVVCHGAHPLNATCPPQPAARRASLAKGPAISTGGASCPVSPAACAASSQASCSPPPEARALATRPRMRRARACSAAARRQFSRVQSGARPRASANWRAACARAPLRAPSL